MLVVGVLIVKAWHAYGPSLDQLKTAVVAVVDSAQTALHNGESPGEQAHPAAGFSKTAPVLENGTKGPVVTVAPPLAPLPPPAVGPTSAENSGNAPIPLAPSPNLPDAVAPPLTAGGTDRLPALLSRLEQLGAAGPKVSPWGSSGHLFRCCCQASRADSPGLMCHFESVATERETAVEQVVAKVEAWRTAQHDDTALR
jgi:hypothetical protein